MIIVASLAAALAVFVTIYTLSSPARPRSVSTRLDRYDRGTGTGREERLAAPFTARVGAPFLGRLRSVAGSVLPQSMITRFERRLMLAGEPISLHAFFSALAVTCIIAVGVWYQAFASELTRNQLIGMLVGGALVAVSPIYWLRLKVLARQNAIIRAFPDAVDLIVTSVEAGLAIDASLAEVGQETQGPLGEELRLTVRETTLGRSRRDALQRLIERTEVPELKTFVQSLIQAEQTGIPIGQVLRTQAAQVRTRRRQRAEVAAQRAPVKMIVVLVLLVLPAMLMMLMGPAIMRMGDQL